MIARTSLLVLLPVVAIFALTRRRRIVAVIGMATFSLLLSSVYLLLYAPDVAITEAAIGAALVTFIYVLAIRRTGRLVVVCDEAPGLLEREGGRIVGLEHAILTRFSRHLGLDLVVRFVPSEEAREMLGRGEADLAAGGIVAAQIEEGLCASTGFLETAFFHIEGPLPLTADRTVVPPAYFADLVEAIRHGRRVCVTLDLARFLAVSRLDLSRYRVSRLPGNDQYVFALQAENTELRRRLEAFLSDLRESGRLERLHERYVR